MEQKPRIILDCDPGIDDAFAIVTAARWADVAGITTVSGNVSLDRTSLKELVGMGYRSTPVTVIGDEKIVGYNTDKIDEALEAAGFV